MASKKKDTRGTRSDVEHLPVIRASVAGIDLGTKEHWVCGPATEESQPNVRVFGTTTPQLEQLADWLEAQGVKSVAMESTSVYWIPVYELLESRGFDVLLVNARELKTVPGRKSDLRDCQWIQKLHSCGLLRGSFRPREEICRLRALQRQLKHLVEERTKAVQWMQKALDQMNVQVHRAVTDITGKTGMAIVRAIVEGERDPAVLATHRDRRCKKSVATIAEHLTGTWRREHLFNLAQSLRLYDHLQEQITAYDEQLQQEMQALVPPERTELTAPKHPKPSKAKDIKRRQEQERHTLLWRFSGVDLTQIDGIGVGAAQIIFTEVGLDLSAFPSEKHFVSWLRLSPRTGYSSGKKIKSKSFGAGRITHVLAMAALTLSRTQTALGAFFRKKARHKEKRIAIFATARKLAQHIYRMLRFGTEYQDEGAKAYDERYRKGRLKSLTSTAKSLGYRLVKDEVTDGLVSG